MQRPDVDLIRAYVDGALIPSGRLEVEAAVSGSEGLMTLVRAMHASRLPYQSAHAQVRCPPVPTALEMRIA